MQRHPATTATLCRTWKSRPLHRNHEPPIQGQLNNTPSRPRRGKTRHAGNLEGGSKGRQSAHAGPRPSRIGLSTPVSSRPPSGQLSHTHRATPCCAPDTRCPPTRPQAHRPAKQAGPQQARRAGAHVDSVSRPDTARAASTRPFLCAATRHHAPSPHLRSVVPSAHRALRIIAAACRCWPSPTAPSWRP